jgi:hypothetical protein
VETSFFHQKKCVDLSGGSFMQFFGTLFFSTSSGSGGGKSGKRPPTPKFVTFLSTQFFLMNTFGWEGGGGVDRTMTHLIHTTKSRYFARGHSRPVFSLAMHTVSGTRYKLSRVRGSP